MMASMANLRPLSNIFLIVAVTIVSVQASRPVKLEKFEHIDPHHLHNPTNGKKPPSQSQTFRRFVTQPANFDEPALPSGGHDGPETQASEEFQWADEFNPEFNYNNPTRPRAGYNYPTHESHVNFNEFFTPEKLAQIEAYNMAQRAKFESQEFQMPVRTTAATSSDSEYPKMLSDGTEILWVDGPRKLTPEEMAQFQELESKEVKPSDDLSAALPQSQQNPVNDAFSASHMHDRYNDAFYNNP